MIPTQDSFLSELFRKYYKQLFIYANTILQNPAEAQDIVQDTFHVAVDRIDVLSNHENPGGWLFQTLKNKIRELERKKRRYLEHIVPILPTVFENLEAPDNAEESVLTHCEKSAAEKIEETLTPEELRLLNQFFLEGKSHKQLADELGISVWASQKRIERIRKKLFEVFPEYKGKK